MFRAVSSRPTLLVSAVLALSLGVTGAAGAAEAWPPAPRGAQAGSLWVMQFSSDRPHEVATEWSKPTAGARLPTADRIKLGQTITTFIVFRGCRPDPASACHVGADLELIDPNGKSVMTKGLKVWPGLPAPAPELLQLSRQSATIGFDAAQQPGEYLVRIVTKDDVSGVALRTEHSIFVQR